MILFLEISIIVFLIIIQSIFGVGLLLFGTPSFLLLGYDFANLIGCDDDTNLYLWMRTSSYSRDDDGDPKDISLFGITYKPTNNISFKFETGTAGDDDVMRLGLGYMF